LSNFKPDYYDLVILDIKMPKMMVSNYMIR
jgi:YesN/AraC family two-component response regulator